MKALVVYATKTGATEKCARMIAEQIPGAVAVNLAKEIPDPREYELIVIGGNIRYGTLQKEADAYLKNCEDILLKKRLGLFLCCASQEQAEHYFASAISAPLLTHATARVWLGGEYSLRGADWIERILMKLLIKSAKKQSGLPKIFPERIPAFVEKLVKEEQA